jgi:hypothetical protein
MSMHRLPLVLLFFACCPARAEIYECVDQNGNKRFTNIATEAKGCKVLNVGPIDPAPSAPAAGTAKLQGKAPPVATPSNFPRVDRALQRERDNDRRRILENELASEEKLLAQARKQLAEQQSVRLGSERNYQRVLDRLEPYENNVRRHEDNVASLRREISKIR